MNKIKKGVIGIAALALLLASLMVPFMSTPVQAHAPQGSSESPEVELEDILIHDKNGDLLQISIDDVAEIEGSKCICVSCSFRVIQTAIAELWGKEIFTQGDLEAVYRHPGKGHKVSFDYILTPECATYEKIGDPRHMTMDHWVYTFTRTDTGEVFETQVKEAVIPDAFFDARYKVKGFKNKWHQDKPSDEEKAEFAAKWSEARDNFLTLPSWELFEDIEEPAEPLPTGGIVFSGLLVVGVIVGFTYSSRGKRD
ncbi:MAG: hypothetical protein SU899_03385 [Chloroflexota bacterium]|nr:hypothetical protein [Chloroflexota bacterium]